MDADYDPPLDTSRPMIHSTQGDRSASEITVTVSHDLGDRTVVILLIVACALALCGWRIGQDQATAEFNGQYLRDLAVKDQVKINHVDELDKHVAALQEKFDAHK